MRPCPRSRKTDIVVQEMESEFLIYDLSVNKAFCLNETSALVFQLCNGQNSVAEISNQMSVKLKTFVSEDFVKLALDALRKDNLIENPNDLADTFAGYSRREAVKKVGFASLAALPIIASVVAPSASMAQSARLPIYGSCSANAQCQSNNCTTSSMLCCVPGVSPFADGSDICATPGTCADFNVFCCSGPVMDLGTGPCGGAGTFCFCA